MELNIPPFNSLSDSHEKEYCGVMVYDIINFQFPIGFSHGYQYLYDMSLDIIFQFPIGFSQEDFIALVDIINCGLSIPYRILTIYEFANFYASLLTLSIPYRILT